MSDPSPALKPHILIVDDDDRLRSLLRRYLAEQGFLVTTAINAADARGKLKSLSYDLMVLDVMMPGESGFDLTKGLRTESKSSAPQLPILLLTARGESNDRIEGLERGADDYMQKPFEPRELLLRINAILRRAPKVAVATSELKLGAWIYNAARDELRSGEQVVRLTDMEASLMRVLAVSPGVALSREALAERADKAGMPRSLLSRGQAVPAKTGAESRPPINDRTIDVQVTRLRRKIEEDARNPRYLVTVRGEGYMLMPDVD